MTSRSGSSQEKLAEIKNLVSNSYAYFKENYQRFREFKRYIYKTTLSESQVGILRDLQQPIIEFNVVESYLSRLLGEFSKHEPSIEASPADGIPIPHETIEVVEGYTRHILHEANKNSFAYNVYKDLLGGGFSVAKVWTDYESPMSMQQKPFLGKVFDPTLCGFDPMARAPHKGDGNFCFEIYPMTEDDFKRTYPDISISTISYTRDLEQFSWSYRDNKDRKIILVGDFYEKKKKRIRIMQLANGHVITDRNYKKLQQYWQDNKIVEQFPVIVGKPRWTELEVICRYRLIQSEILEYVETDYSYLPLVFIDGNSEILTQGASNSTYQMTRPCIYNARGTQDLKNFAGQSWANYLENLIQHKFIVKKEAIPQEEDYIKAFRNVQKASILVVNAYSENNPDKPIQEPIREVVNPPAPPEIVAAFQSADATIQSILGSYASNLGKNDNDLSGKAVIEASSVGNAASMPYIVGYLQGLTQIGNILVDLYPKYIKGARTIPIVSKKGDKEYRKINQEGAPYLDYADRSIILNIDAGVNFQVQKNQALTQMIALMGVSQEFNQFMNSPQGLPILVKNLTIYGSDELQEAVPEWLQMQQQQAQRQQQQQMELAQQAQQQNPQMIRAQVEAQKVQQQAQQQQIENQFEIARLGIEDKLADAEILTAESKVTQAQIDSAVRLEESNNSQINHSLETAAKLAEIKDREHAREMDHHHSIRESVKLIKEHSNNERNESYEAE